MADSPESSAIPCQALARQATEYLEDRLPADARAAIDAHLAACSACRTYVDQLRLVRDSLRKLPEAKDETQRQALTERFARAMRDNKNV